MEECSMVQPGTKPSVTERELQAYSDELVIRHHAERLEANLGTDRAIEVLDQVMRTIAARRAPPPAAVIKAARR
jgi:hypothetical protein